MYYKSNKGKQGKFEKLKSSEENKCKKNCTY